MLFKVYVQPDAPSLQSSIDRSEYQCGTNTLVLRQWRYDRIQDECVFTAVPCDVDETKKHGAAVGAHPPQAVFRQLNCPVVVAERQTERVGMKPIEFVIVELSAPLVADGVTAAHREECIPLTIEELTQT